MKFTLPPIYPITDTRISSLSHFEQVKRLVDGGATLIQIREKELPPDQWISDACEAVKFAHDCGVRIIVNDRTDVALAVGADGVHLGQDDLPPEMARKLLGKQAIIGFSTHSLEQAREALRLPVDYIAAGPIFNTPTKKDPDRPVGLVLLKQISRLTSDLPLVAIGGISSTNISDVFAAGANSAALIGSILALPLEIENRMREMFRLVEKAC